jgi:hypothetical protein
MAKEAETLTEFEYKIVLDSAMVIAQLASTNSILSDLPRAIRTAEYSDTVAPFIDPTLWMKGHGNLHKQIEIMRLLQTFRMGVQKVLETP